MTIRKRAKVSARYAQESGRYINKAPYAYINGRGVDGKMVIQVNEPDRHIVEKIYRDYLNDIPHYIIHQEAKQLGFPHTASSSVFRILNNPLYCGLVRVCAHGKQPEKLVKGIHEAIVPEYLYHRAQEKLKRNKRKMVAKPKEEYPLKGLIKSPCCGRDLTAGWSTGKKQKYLYYRCLDHSNVNIAGKELHDKFEELLRYLSFKQEFIDEVVEVVATKVKQGLKSSTERQQEIRMQLRAVDTKIENVEEKLFSDVINDQTYKRSMVKFNAEKAALQQELENLDNIEDNIQQDLLVLPYMINLHQIYKDAPVGQKHALVREVFKDGLTYFKGVFRTPSVNPALDCNVLILKEIGLLEIEQAYHFENSFSSCGEGGFRTCPCILLIFRLLRDGQKLTHHMTHHFSSALKEAVNLI